MNWLRGSALKVSREVGGGVSSGVGRKIRTPNAVSLGGVPFDCAPTKVGAATKARAASARSGPFFRCSRFRSPARFLLTIVDHNTTRVLGRGRRAPRLQPPTGGVVVAR